MIYSVVAAGGTDEQNEDAKGMSESEDPALEEYSAETMDVNLQLYFRLNCFTGGSAEQLIYYFSSNFMRYDSTTGEEM